MPSRDAGPDPAALAAAFGGADNIGDADGSGRHLIVRVRRVDQVSEHALAALGFVGVIKEGDRFELLGPFDAADLGACVEAERRMDHGSTFHPSFTHPSSTGNPHDDTPETREVI